MHEEIIFSYTGKFKTIDYEPILFSFGGVPGSVQCSKLGTFTVMFFNLISWTFYSNISSTMFIDANASSHSTFWIISLFCFNTIVYVPITLCRFFSRIDMPYAIYPARRVIPKSTKKWHKNQQKKIKKITILLFKSNLLD